MSETQSGNILDSLAGAGNSIADIFINLSSEYGAILDLIFFAFAALGVLICASCFFDIIKFGKSDSLNYSPGASFLEDDCRCFAGRYCVFCQRLHGFAVDVR